MRWPSPGRFCRHLRFLLLPLLLTLACSHDDTLREKPASDEGVMKSAGDDVEEGALQAETASDVTGERLEAAIDRVTERKAGYLVVESVPLLNTTHTAPEGERTPGTTLLTCLIPKAGMAYDDFLKHWQVVQRRVALETQSTYLYIRNVVVQALTQDAPPWVGIVEEGFPTEAVTDPMLWYKASGSKKTYEENFAKMMDSVNAFLDLSQIESHPTSEYIIKG